MGVAKTKRSTYHTAVHIPSPDVHSELAGGEGMEVMFGPLKNDRSEWKSIVVFISSAQISVNGQTKAKKNSNSMMIHILYFHNTINIQYDSFLFILYNVTL